jgi:hypothetical protein
VNGRLWDYWITVVIFGFNYQWAQKVPRRTNGTKFFNTLRTGVFSSIFIIDH